jgi:hypothetical protein
MSGAQGSFFEDGWGFLRPVLKYCLSKSSTTFNKNTCFRVTHSFHPLAGREFTLVIYRNNWEEQRVFFYNDQGELISLPAKWTSLFPEDPLVFLSTENAFFRSPDLLELACLLKSASLVLNATLISERRDGDV